MIAVMKKVKKMTKKEPTISDVMGVVDGLTGKMDSLTESLQDLTEAVQTGFARNEEKFDRHEKIITALYEGQENLTDRLNDIDRRLINTQNRVEDVAEMLEENGEQIFDHERRLLRVEKVVA